MTEKLEAAIVMGLLEDAERDRARAAEWSDVPYGECACDDCAPAVKDSKCKCLCRTKCNCGCAYDEDDPAAVTDY